MHFEFATATRILFGEGSVREIAPTAKAMGARALMVTGRSLERAAPLVTELKAAGVACCGFSVESEPTIELIRRGVEQARREKCDLVVAFGGGSVIDAGKAIAGLLTNHGALSDYLEVIGRGQPLDRPSAPLIAVPTTSGTGSEVTRNAVLASTVARVKVSLRSPFLLPRLAVVDPDLTIGLPPEITASTGLDALTQLIEPYVSVHGNPLTDSFCLEGLRRVSRSLRRAYHDGRNREARRDMSLASLLGGLALANAGLGVVHGIAGPLGGMFPAPHGGVCAALLPHGMEVNLRALRARAPASEGLCRYEAVARVLTSRPNAIADEGIEWVKEICRELRIPPLSSYGVGVQDVEVLVEKAAKASSTKGNPIGLAPEELRQVLSRALDAPGLVGNSRG
jgi:alcohol dehydrogenase class IV